MKRKNPFDQFARLYDWEHDGYLADVDVHLAFARRFGGPVLELACGSGRLLAPLAQAGFGTGSGGQPLLPLGGAEAALLRHPQDPAPGPGAERVRRLDHRPSPRPGQLPVGDADHLR